jgi:hypothetical protein
MTMALSRESNLDRVAEGMASERACQQESKEICGELSNGCLKTNCNDKRKLCKNLHIRVEKLQ